MLHQPLKRRPPARNISGSTTLPAPFGGWNARDSLAAMRETDAVIMDNWFPEEKSIVMRDGFSNHVSGLINAVETLATYSSPTSEEMWAVAGGGIYDVSVTSTTPSAVVSALTNSRFQHVNYGTAGGHYLMMVNGADDLQYYDGTSWDVINSTSTPAITGVDTADLININAFKRRLFFIENNSTSFWYLPVNAIGGAAEEFDLAPLLSMGGRLVAMGSWTRDAGDGPDDFAVFITSEGEAIVYQGMDPGDANAWALVGIFRVGKPIGDRCMRRIGPELFIICEDGFYPLRRAIGSARTNQSAALSDKIRDAVRQAMDGYASNFGWEMTFYPRKSWLLVNVPVRENSTAHQYVANTTTGAWCRFTNMDANTWALFNGEIYFGSQSIVYKADDGPDDAGSLIPAQVQQAYTYLGSPGNVKNFHMLRPIMTIEGQVTLAIDVLVDFEGETSIERTIYVPPVTAPTWNVSAWNVTPWVANPIEQGIAAILDVQPQGGAVWNEAEWNVASWTAGTDVVKRWKSVGQIGIAGSIRIRNRSTSGPGLTWIATNWIWQTGGLL